MLFRINLFFVNHEKSKFLHVLLEARKHMFFCYKRLAGDKILSFLFPSLKMLSDGKLTIPPGVVRISSPANSRKVLHLLNLIKEKFQLHKKRPASRNDGNQNAINKLR